jgi:hypothetical protein
MNLRESGPHSARTSKLGIVTDNAAEKAAENRLRRKAERQGLTLRKSARRDPDATDYGVWSLHNAASGTVVLQGSLQDVEQYLTGR